MMSSKDGYQGRKPQSSKRKNPRPSTSKGKQTPPGPHTSRTPGCRSGKKPFSKQSLQSQPYKSDGDFDDMESDAVSSEEETLIEDVIVLEESPLRKGQKKRKKSFNLSPSDTRTDTSASDGNYSYSTIRMKRLKLQSRKKSPVKGQNKAKCKSSNDKLELSDIILETNSLSQESSDSRSSQVNMEANIHPTNIHKTKANVEQSATGKMFTKTVKEGKYESSTLSKGKTPRRMFRRKINYAGRSSTKKRHISSSSSESDSENNSRRASSKSNYSEKTRSIFDCSGPQNSVSQTGHARGHSNKLLNKRVKTKENETVNSSSSTVCSDDDLFLTQTEFTNVVYKNVTDNHLDTPSIVRRHDGNSNTQVATGNHSAEDSDSTVRGTPPQEVQEETQIPELTLQFTSSDNEEDVILLDLNSSPPDLTPQSSTHINNEDEEDYSMPLLGDDRQDISKDDPYKFPSQSQSERSNLPPFKHHRSNEKTSRSVEENNEESSSSSDDIPLRSLLQSRRNFSEAGGSVVVASTSMCELEDKDVDLPNLSYSSRSRSNRPNTAKLQKKDSNSTEDYWEEKPDKSREEIALKKQESDATEDYWMDTNKSDPVNTKNCDDGYHVPKVKEEPDNLKYGYTQENDTIWLDSDDDDESFQMSQHVVQISSEEDEEEEESQSMLLEDRDDDDLRDFFNIQDLEFEEDLKLESEANHNHKQITSIYKGDYSSQRRADRVDKSHENGYDDFYAVQTQIDNDYFDRTTQHDKNSRKFGDDENFDADTQIDVEVSDEMENTVPYVIDDSDEDDSYIYGALTQADKSFSSEDNDLPDICEDDHVYDAETQFDRQHDNEADMEFYAMETQADRQLSDKCRYDREVLTQVGRKQYSQKDEIDEDITKKDLCVDNFYGAATQIDVCKNNAKSPSHGYQSFQPATDMFKELSDSDGNDDLYDAQTQIDPAVMCAVGNEVEKENVYDHIKKGKKLYTTNTEVSKRSDSHIGKSRPTTMSEEEQRKKKLGFYDANTQIDGTDVFGEESDAELFEVATQFDPTTKQENKAEVIDSDFVTTVNEDTVDDKYSTLTQVDNMMKKCESDRSDEVTSGKHSNKSLDKCNSHSGIRITAVYKGKNNDSSSTACKNSGGVSDVFVKDLSGGDLPNSDVQDGNTYNRAEVFLDLEEDDAYDTFTQVDTDKHPIDPEQDMEDDIVIIDDDEEEKDPYIQPTQVDDVLGSSSDTEDVDLAKETASDDEEENKEIISELDFDWYSIQTQIGKPKIDESDSEKDNDDNLLSFHGLRIPKGRAEEVTSRKPSESDSEVGGKKSIYNRLKLTPEKRKAIVTDPKPQKTLKEKRDSFTIEKESFYSTKQKTVKRRDSNTTGGATGTWLSKGSHIQTKLPKPVASRRRRPSKSKATHDSADDLKKKMLEAKNKMAHRTAERIAEPVPHAKRQKTQRETRCGDVSDVQMPDKEEIMKKGLPMLESVPQKRRSEVIQDVENITPNESLAAPAMSSKHSTDTNNSSHKERDTTSHKEKNTSSHKGRDSSTQKEKDISSHKERDSLPHKERDTSSQKEKDTLTNKERDTLAQKGRHHSSHKEKDIPSYQERDISSHKEKDSSSSKEKDTSSHKERDTSLSHQKRNTSSHEARDTLLHKGSDTSAKKVLESSLTERKDMSSRKNDKAKDKRKDSSHNEKDSSHRERHSSSHRERDSSLHRERDSSSHRKGESSLQREKDSSSHKKRESTSHKEKDSSSHREGESLSQRERDSLSHRKKDGASHKEKDSSSHRESNSSSHREKDSSSHREKDSSSHRERDRSSHRKKDSSSHTEKDSSSYTKKDSSSHKKKDDTSHKEKGSSHRKRDSSHKEKDVSQEGEDDVANRNGISAQKEQENSLKELEHISQKRERSCSTSDQNARDTSSISINQTESSDEQQKKPIQGKDDPSKSETSHTSEMSSTVNPQVSTGSSDKVPDGVSLCKKSSPLSPHEPQVSNVMATSAVEPQVSVQKSVTTLAAENVTTAQTTTQPQAVVPKSILTKGKEKKSRKANVTFCLNENTEPPKEKKKIKIQDLKHLERKHPLNSVVPQRSADVPVNQPIRAPVRPQYANLMQKPVPGVSKENQIKGSGLPELPGLQTGPSNRPGQPLSDITPQGQIPIQYISLDHFLTKLLKWNPVWFNEQEKFKAPPPQIEEENPLFPLNEAYSSYNDYVKIFTPHLLFETWEMACHGWKQQKQQGCPHHSVCLSGLEFSQEKQLMIIVCYYVTSKRKYNQGLCPTEGDLVVNHTYIHARAPPPKPGLPPKEGPQWHPTLGFVEKVQPYWREDMSAKIMRALPLLKKEADKIQPPQDQLILCLRIKSRHRNFKLLHDKPSSVQYVVSLVSLIRQFVAMTTLPESRLMKHILQPGYPGVYNEKHMMTKTQQQQLSSYNSSQQKAICTAAKVAGQSHILPRVCLLQGPPGTGKSHTIVGIIDKIVRDSGRQARICLCAPSNAAIDELVRKFIAHKKQMTKKSGNYVLRLVRIGTFKSMHRDVVRYSFNELVKKTIETEIKLKNEKNVPESTRTELQSLAKKTDILRKQLDDLRRKQELAQVKRVEMDLGKLEKKRRDLENQCNKMFRELKLTPGEEIMIKKNVLWKANVICGTLNSFGSSSIQNLLAGVHENLRFTFDCLIVDEASQATELDCLIPLQYNTSKLIMVGDPEQLPPTVLSKMAADKCFGQSLFERLFGFFRYKDDNPVLFLDTQYRMDPQIAAFPSQYVYQGKLKSDVSVELKCRDFPLKPYIVFDLLAGQEMTSASGSVSNKAEADFTVALCSFILNSTKMPQCSIGIIAPYQSQKSLLFELLCQHKMTEVEVGTVDGFQGREKQVIVLSCVRARSVTGGIGFLADRRRLNVSLTRAKSALYVVGHLDSLEQAGGDWKMLIQDARNRGMITRVGHQQNYQDVVKVCWKSQ